MSEQDKQGDAEQVIDSQSPDSLTDSTSNTEETAISDAELAGEESDSTLDLDKELPEPKNKEHDSNPALEQRQKQVDTWSQRFADGEVERDEIPKWVLKEIDFTDNEPDIDARIDAKVTEKLTLNQDTALYNKLSGELKKVKITKAQKEKLLTRLDGLRTKLPKGEALEIALETAGIQFSQKETKKRPQSMNPPGINTKGEKTGIDGSKNWAEVQKTSSEEDRRKYLIAETRQ